MTSPDHLRPVIAPQLSDLPGIRHAFFTRHGGISTGVHAGLNVGLGSEDDRQSIAGNRDLAARWLGAARDDLATPYQVHSPDVVTVTAPLENLGDARPRADSVVTATPGIVAGVLTADCGPVLFADPKARVVGAAHAGWKGATGGVLENTISAMERIGARRPDIIAILGPMISQANYEVGPEFVERLAALDPANDRYLTAADRAGHAMFDLARFIVDRLEAAGVRAAWTGHCTYAREADFYSYRRKTHRGEPDYGRQLSAIVLTG